MYGVAGERRLTEYVADWLPGYDGNPVRIGNAAADQFQLDVYGEVMDALHQARPAGLSGGRQHLGAAARADEVRRRATGSEPDEGIWEVRGGPQHFTHSKLMAWVAADRAVKASRNSACDGPVERVAAAARRHPRRHPASRGTTRERSTFTQYYGSEELDAALLMVPAGRLPAGRRRAGARHRRGHREASCCGTGSCSATPSGPSTDADGLPRGEGAFLACTFWLADNYALMGRADEAPQLFERLLALRNDRRPALRGVRPAGRPAGRATSRRRSATFR